ncbi:MAG: metallophosphoesterase [Roseibacillus sp.]
MKSISQSIGSRLPFGKPAAHLPWILVLGLGSALADDYPIALRPSAPVETGVARGWLDGLQVGPGESHALLFPLAASIPLSIATTSDGVLNLSLLDPSGAIVASSAVASGRSVGIQSFETTAPGQWRLTIHNPGATPATVSTEILAAAALDTNSNSGMASAQDLQAAFRTTLGKCRFAAVTGKVAPGVGASDWYRFSLTSPKRFSVWARPARSVNSPIITLRIFDSGGQLIGETDSAVPYETPSPREAGDYFVEVAEPGVSYSLSIVTGGSVASISGDRPSCLLGLMPPRVGPSATCAYVADFGSGSSNEAKVANMIKVWSPEFIFTGGDNIYANGNVGVGVSGWKTMVGDFYGEFIQARTDGLHPELTSPLQRFFPSIGNQDTTIAHPGGGDISGYLDYFLSNPGGEPRLPTSGGAVHTGGESFYRVRRGAIELFVLDTDHARQNPASMAKQRAWLPTAVASSHAPWRFVIAHHPPWSSTKANNGFPELRWIDTVGAEAVFSGDAHVYERLDISGDGLPFIICGLGGHSRARFNANDALPQSRSHYRDDYAALKIESASTYARIECWSVDDGANGGNGGSLVDSVQLGSSSTTDTPLQSIAFQLDGRPLAISSLTKPHLDGTPNALDLHLRLSDDGGQTVAEDDNSAPDGRNARLLVNGSFEVTLDITRQTDAGGNYELVFLDPFDAWWFDLPDVVGSDPDPGFDPDRDGLSTWLEYAFATDPFQASAPVWATVDENDSTMFLVRYPQRNDAGARGLHYTVEVSPNLQQWFDDGDNLAAVFGAGFTISEQLVSNLPGGVDQWEVSLPLGFGEVYFRIRVTGQ